MSPGRDAARLASGLLICVALALPWHAASATETTGNANPPAPRVDANALESPGAAAVRKVPREILNLAKPKRFSLEARRAEEEAAKQQIDEIRVFGQRDPDDVVKPKKPPIQALRERLEKDRPMTPAEKAKLALCLIGLCAANYGPEGIPVEGKAFTRGESGAGKSSLEMSQQFRGTLQ